MDDVHLEGEGQIAVGVLRAPVVDGAPVEMLQQHSKKWIPTEQGVPSARGHGLA